MTPYSRHPTNAAIQPSSKAVILTLNLPKWKNLHVWLAAARKHAKLTLIAAALVLCFTPCLHAQGCAQCLDSTRATPPAVQAGYRHAIFLLGGTGAALFIVGTLLIRRER